MNRLLYTLILLLPLTACQRVEKSAESLSSEQQLDSLLASKVSEFMRAYAVDHQIYYLDESTFVPSKISNRLFESWYDDGCFLLLVNRKDTSVLDILYDMPVAPNVAIFLEGVNITDSAWMEHWQKDECCVVSDTLIIDRFMIYTYHQSDWNTDKADTLFMAKTETRYRIDNEKFVYESQQKDSLYFDSVAYRLLSPCEACYAIHGIDYEGPCPGCE